MSDSLPQGWTESTLEELLTSLESGSRPKGGVKGIKQGVPSIGGEHLSYSGKFDFSNIRYVPEGFAKKMKRGRIQKNDILIVKDGATTGKTSFVDQHFPFNNAVVNEHVFICRPSGQVNPKYLFWFLFSKEGQDSILENFKGSAQGGINTTFTPNVRVPLAPLAEQDQIVRRLDALMAQLDSGRDRLERIPQILRRFRQAILTSAVCGELTNHSGKESRELPTCNLGEILVDVKYGTAQKCDSKKHGVPVLRIPNIVEGIIVHEDMKYAELPAKEYEKLKLIPGDILMIRSNGSVSLIGKTGIVADKESGFAYAGYLIRLRCDKQRIMPEYLNISLASNAVRLQIEIPSRSTSGVHNINSEEVKSLNIPLPTIEDQGKIIQAVKKLFMIVDQIEVRYRKTKGFVDELPQSVIAKAFRGELGSIP